MDLHTAYHAWLMTEKAWQEELEREYGKNACDARYDYARHSATTELQRLRDAWDVAEKIYRTLCKME